MGWGEKRNETRSWYTPHSGWIAIHAAAKPVDADALDNPSIRAACTAHLGRADQHDWAFPLRKVVGIRWLAGCIRVQDRTTLTCIDGKDVMIPPMGKEREFGDYRAGRFAWHTTHGIALPTPVIARGMQQIWNWSVPPETEAFLRAEIERRGLPPLDSSPPLLI